MSIHTIAKNTSFITGASVLQKVFSFVYFTLVARTIGVEATGQYTFALAFTTVFVIFIDLGFGQVLIREGAKQKEKLQQYFSNILFAKLFLGLITYTVLYSIVSQSNYAPLTQTLILISGVTMLFDSLHLSCYGVLRALQELKYEAYGIIGSQAFTLLIGSFFLFTDAPLSLLMLAFLIPSMCNVIYVCSVLIKKHHIYPTPSYNKKVLRPLIHMMIPFAIAAVFARLYSYADTLILAHIAGESAVGLYSVPYKITYAFQFIPLALGAALYPKFSHSFEHDPAQIPVLLRHAIVYLFLSVIPIAVGLSVLAPTIIPFIYTDAYTGSVLTLQILLAGLVFSFFTFPLGALLNACNKQRTQTTIVICALILNVALNIILIPQYSIIGAALSALVGNIFFVICELFAARSLVQGWFARAHTTLLKIAAAGALMGACVWYSTQYVHFLISIGIGAIVYIVALFVTRVFTTDSLRRALASAR
jgi:O-antigen/teichoic acid export membrane protein